VGDRAGAYRVLVRISEEKKQIGKPGVDGIFKKRDVEALTCLIWLRIGRGGGRL
jgi:hypothetical protein